MGAITKMMDYRVKPGGTLRLGKPERRESA
jgi:hypothetical protein